MTCSCPDWAGMCKHVAATLYGVGARLDSDPDVLFTLRGVNRSELISTRRRPLDHRSRGRERTRARQRRHRGAVRTGDRDARCARRRTQRKSQRRESRKRPSPRAEPPCRRRKRGAAESAMERVDALRLQANAEKSDDRRSATPNVAAKSLAKRPKAPEPVRPTVVAATKSERPIAAKAATGPTPKRKTSAGSAEGEKQSEGRARLAKWIGAKARKAARP